jgi:hypothetical protein
MILNSELTNIQKCSAADGPFTQPSGMVESIDGRSAQYLADRKFNGLGERAMKLAVDLGNFTTHLTTRQDGKVEPVYSPEA